MSETPDTNTPIKPVTPPRSRALDLLILAVLTLIVSLPGLSRIPPIDRDEARYAQATVQMIDSGDYVDIRFQEAPRWKKPAGAYWAQAASVMALSSPQARAIWAHRVPSVLGALLAVFATYIGGRRLIGRRGALIGAALLAVSLSLIYEAHAAKTDALLAGFTAICFAALAYMRTGQLQGFARHKWGVIFWAALGLAIMMKGPITPVIILTCLATLRLWEREAGWMKPLLLPLGPLICLAIVLPWTVLIYQKTGGAFFQTALGEDLGGKMSGQAENHGGLPGYYALTVWAMFWPGVAFIIPGLSFAVKALKYSPNKMSTIPKAVRFLICFALPWWIIIEIAPTKLPHYTLPVYPAIALLAGTAAAMLYQVKEFPIARRVSALLYGVIGIALVFGLVAALGYYGPDRQDVPIIELGVAMLIVILICAALYCLWNARGKLATYFVIGSGIALWGFGFGWVLPNLDRASISQEVAKLLQETGASLPLNEAIEVYTPHFSEPSLVFALGTHIKTGSHTDVSDLTKIPQSAYLIFDALHKDGPKLAEAISHTAHTGDKCFHMLGEVAGMNYSKGDKVRLIVLQEQACPQPQ